MKILILASVLTSFIAFAATPSTQIKYISDVIANASPEETKDLGKLLGQLSFVPAHKDQASGEQLFKITMVEKNSIYDKAGIKVGDLISNGTAKLQGQKLWSKLGFTETHKKDKVAE